MIALIVLVIIVTTVWAAFDAGVHEGFVAGLVVFVGCALLWILVFPLYLVKRGQRERGDR
jgi:hypothetical protein